MKGAGKLRMGVQKYADGGPVRLYPKAKMKRHVPAKVKDPIKKGEPGGSQTPGAKAKRKKAEGKKMADGGKVVGKSSKKRKPKPGMLGTGMAAKAGEALRDTRAKQMKDLGI